MASGAYAGNGKNDDPAQEQKKTAKPKYDFNLFKFFSIPLQETSDSLKTAPSAKSKTLFLTQKTNFYRLKES